tara:strand:+ start:622 stop:1098 length:477 start_codon:yes stop_codon:yes gene_type:complete
MTHTPPTDGHLLNETEWLTLRALADTVIPPSEEYGVPGAGDEAICKDLVKTAGKRLARLIEALEELNRMADAQVGSDFAALGEEQRETVALAFRAAHPGHAHHVEILASQCYYRDTRVMISLGMEPRPPHPQGYDIKQGDWSLLDLVRTRTAFHRAVE